MLPRLETLVIQITVKCPNNCPQCYMKRGEESISLDVAKRYIDKARDMGAVAVQLTGGEPLVYGELDELIEYIHARGMYSLLATSGYSHSDERYSRLAECGLSAICVSVNGMSEEKNSETRDGFAESLSAIRCAVRHGLHCFANVVVTDDNIAELGLMGEYLRSRGVCAVNLLRPVRSYDGAYIPRLSESTVAVMREIVSEDEDFWNVENCFVEYWRSVRDVPFVCSDVGALGVFVNADGTVSPCSKTQHLRYSDIAEMQSNKEKWQGGCLG